ncbi:MULTISPECIES: FtsX-like permease family protein [unclassified Nocardioides]|uniref:FtsX-like permease family protein n=1 Tax=unclassified Nocardioides TaxID=2615069 RepID=UPI003014BBF9
MRLHGPTLRGRVRSDPGLLLLMGLVVALTTALTAAVAPLTDRTGDRAFAEAVRDAGLRGAVVATLPEGYDDPRGERTRDPGSATELRQATSYAQGTLPGRLARVLRPGVATTTTPALQLLDAGPGRYLRLAYVDTPTGEPAVTYTAGHAPRAAVGEDRADAAVPADAGPWPVQVALSEAAAAALDVGPGDRLPAEDEQHREVLVRVSGVYVASDPDDDAWQVSTELLEPSQGISEGVLRTSAAALVSAAALPDLRLAVPADDLTQRILFTPRPERLRWRDSRDVERAVASLQTTAGVGGGDLSWDSLLDRVLADERAQVASAQGQAQVLLLGLLACALLVLTLGAQLLVRRRAGPVVVARERGASLAGLAGELLVESLLVAVGGAAVGLGAVALLVGTPGWGWSLPVLAIAVGAAPVLGAVLAARATGARRVPANRAARRTAARSRRLTRLVLEASMLVAAGLAVLALRQRGVVGADLTAASAPTWWAVAGAVVLLRLLPPAARLALRGGRRTTGTVRFLAAARIAETGARALPLLVATVAVAQLTVGVALAATEREGQAAGALLVVGGDARLTTAPGADLSPAVAAAPGVRAATSGRVEDGVRASSRGSADSVRLVVVDASSYASLLAASALPDAPRLARLRGGGDRVPALLLGGDAGLRDGLVVRWDDENVPLDVVGTAPRVDASVDPVVVVDAAAFADAGAVARPDTVWAVGPGAADALEATGAGVVLRYDDELAARRDAPLAAGLVRLAVATSALLLLLAVLGVVLAAAAEAPARGESLGRLRALGLGDRELRRVLGAELVVPVAVAALAGLALGVGASAATFGSLSLERITGQTTAPDLVLPWWTVLAVVVLVGAVLVVARVEWRRLRRRSLAGLLRG